MVNQEEIKKLTLTTIKSMEEYQKNIIDKIDRCFNILRRNTSHIILATKLNSVPNSDIPVSIKGIEQFQILLEKKIKTFAKTHSKILTSIALASYKLGIKNAATILTKLKKTDIKETKSIITRSYFPK